MDMGWKWAARKADVIAALQETLVPISSPLPGHKGLPPAYDGEAVTLKLVR